MVKLGDVVTFGKNSQITGTVLGIYGNYMTVVEEGKENLLNSISTKEYKINFNSVRKLKTSIISPDSDSIREISKDLLKPGDLISFKNSDKKYLVIDTSDEGIYYSLLEHTNEILGTGVAKLENIDKVFRTIKLATFPKIDLNTVYDNSISKSDYSVSDDLSKAETEDFLHNGKEFLQVIDNKDGVLTTVSSSGVIETVDSGTLVTKNDISDISSWLTNLNSLALSETKTTKYPDSFYAEKGSIEINNNVLTKGSVVDDKEKLKDPIEVFGKKEGNRWARSFDLSMNQINNFDTMTIDEKKKLLKPGFFYNLKIGDKRSGKLWQIKGVQGNNYRVAYSAYNLKGNKITLERTIDRDTLLNQIAEAYISSNNIALNNTLKTLSPKKQKSSLVSTTSIEDQLKELTDTFGIKIQLEEKAKTKAHLKNGVIYYKKNAVFENVLHEFLHILLATYKKGDVESYFKLITNYVKLTESKDITSFIGDNSALEEEIVNELVSIIQNELKNGTVDSVWEDVIRIAFNTLNGNDITEPVNMDDEMFSLNNGYDKIVSESTGFKSWLDEQLKEEKIKINCK